MTITWNCAAGNATVKGFAEAFDKGGGKVIEDLRLLFPNVEFQALLTGIAAHKPDVVFALFAAGLRRTIALVGSALLTGGTLQAQGARAQGPITALHDGDDSEVPRNTAYRKRFAVTDKAHPDAYAMQRDDTAQTLAAGHRPAAAGGPCRRCGRRQYPSRRQISSASALWFSV